MLKTISFESDADHVVALELDGPIASRDFENVLAAVEDKLQRHDKLRIYIEIKSLGGVAPDALLKDLKAAVKHWNRFDKQAVVTDLPGFDRIVPLADKVMPGIELRAFSFNEREPAHQWVIG